MTTGGSTVAAIERIREEGLEIAAPSASSIAWPAAARRSPRRPARRSSALVTIDEIYPDRPDRAG